MATNPGSWRITRTYKGIKTAPVIIVNPSAGDIDSLILQRCLKAWQSRKKHAEDIPDVTLFDDDSFASIAKNLILIKVLADESGALEYRYLHYGANIRSAYGADMTGQRTVDFPSDIGTFFRETFVEALDKRLPVFSMHRPPETVPVQRWRRLVLPLGTTTATWVLVVNLPTL